jgi:hypothetical protein
MAYFQVRHSQSRYIHDLQAKSAMNIPMLIITRTLKVS